MVTCTVCTLKHRQWKQVIALVFIIKSLLSFTSHCRNSPKRLCKIIQQLTKQDPTINNVHNLSQSIEELKHRSSIVISKVMWLINKIICRGGSMRHGMSEMHCLIYSLWWNSFLARSGVYPWVITGLWCSYLLPPWPFCITWFFCNQWNYIILEDASTNENFAGSVLGYYYS